MTSDATITPELLDQLLANYEKKTSPVDAEGWRTRNALTVMRLCAIQWLSGQGARPARVGKTPGAVIRDWIASGTVPLTAACFRARRMQVRHVWETLVFTILPTARDATFICRF